MYGIAHRIDPRSSWRMQSRIFDDREKAANHAEAERDRTRGGQFRVIWLGDPEDWKKA